LLVVAPDAQGVARVHAIGAWSALRPRFPDLPVTDHRGWLLAPGFIDLHSHHPQTDIIGAPAHGLLSWFEAIHFPARAALCRCRSR